MHGGQFFEEQYLRMSHDKETSNVAYVSIKVEQLQKLDGASIMNA